MQAGDWHHYAMTASALIGEVSFYIDGALIGSAALAPGNQIDSNPIYFGSNFINGGQSQFLNGQLDDIRIYTRALAADDVTELAHAVPSPNMLLLLALGLGFSAMSRR